MKRSPLHRTKGLARGGRLGHNAKRRRKLRTYQHGTTERTRWFRSLPCVCQGKHPACTGGWSEPSHVVSRGAGGTASDIVPMSRGCHQAWHDHGQLMWCSYSGIAPMDDCPACGGKGRFWWDGEDYHPPGWVVCPDCILAALRHLARTHYATQGPDAPGDST